VENCDPPTGQSWAGVFLWRIALDRLPNLDDYDGNHGDDEEVEDVLTQHFGSSGWYVFGEDDDAEDDDWDVDDGLAESLKNEVVDGPYAAGDMRINIIGANHVKVIGGGIFWRSDNDIAWIKKNWQREPNS
jgi:hypothetical protein